MDETVRGYLGWHARNCLLHGSGASLVDAVENCVGELAEDTVAEALKRLRQREEGTTSVRRQRLLEQLAGYAAPPPENDAARANLSFAAAEFELAPLDVRILELVLRSHLVHELDSLADMVVRKLGSASACVAALIGEETRLVHSRLLPNAPLVASGVLALDLRGGSFSGRNGVLDMPGSLRRAMLRPYRDREQWAAAILGAPCQTNLSPDDFPHLEAETSLFVGVLSGAGAEGAAGLNLLLHGPVGTGKTELAKALAQAAGCRLWSVGETDEEGAEPTRAQRVAAVRLAKRLLARRGDAVLLVDEAEDILVSRAFAGERAGSSKVYLNRLLESSGPPVIWTANDISNFDPSCIRRMVMAAAVPEPPAPVRRRIWSNLAREMGASVGMAAASRLADAWEAPPAVIRSALRAAVLAGGGEETCALAMRGVMEALGRTPSIDAVSGAEFDPEIVGCETDLEQLAQRLCRAGAPRAWSMLVTGPSGTGKSRYARYLAERLGMPVLQQRASDLISKWVGESERNIAGAFARARSQRAVLVFDEADSLLCSRDTARARWEVSQVNEMLTWMEAHPLPFVCTTNLLPKLDDASLRRFTFKLKFAGMSVEQAERHFNTLFGESARGLPDGLTPGDFAVAQRRRLFEPEADVSTIIEWLGGELANRSRGGPVGFDLPKRRLVLTADQQSR